MSEKAPNPAPLLEGPNVPPDVRFYFELTHLKRIFRRGWLQRGIPASLCESVAEHAFSAALVAGLLVDGFPGLNRLRVLELCLVHDLGEVHAGDITPADGVDPVEKRRRERESVRRLFAGLPSGRRWTELWEEYEAGLTGEARFVRQAEKVEMALQAAVYEAEGFPVLADFLSSARKDVSDQVLLELLEGLSRLAFERRKPPGDGEPRSRPESERKG